ncbi:MAG: PilZ domain-containing protein [Deltaproteobacteria bacterium]|nr:PilZ domain-containing protein [Deltaproteobacteria bacterium]
MSGKEGSERRVRERHLVCVTAEVRPDEDNKQVAVIHDMSVEGVYLHAQAPVPEGESVALTIRLTSDPEGPTVDTTAQAVRVDRLPRERADFWTHGIALRFDEPLADLEEEIGDLAAKLKKAGVTF